MASMKHNLFIDTLSIHSYTQCGWINAPFEFILTYWFSIQI
jgi:hypothetical protein